MLSPKASERAFLIGYAAVVAALLCVIYWTEVHPAPPFYIIALLWPVIVFGWAVPLLLLVPLSAAHIGYRYNYLSLRGRPSPSLRLPYRRHLLGLRYNGPSPLRYNTG